MYIALIDSERAICIRSILLLLCVILVHDTIVSPDCISKVSVGTEKYSKTRTNGAGGEDKGVYSVRKREKEREKENRLIKV